MRTNKFGLAAASTAAVAALLIGGATLANAADNPTPTTPSATSSAASSAGSSAATVPGDATAGTPGDRGQQGASQDTPVTGDEATRVSAAVTAKDSTVTVESVRKDPDGSYDVLGSKAGAKVMFDVSADLATITENAGGPGGQGGHGPHDATGQQGQQGQPGQPAPASTSTATTN